MTGMTGRVIGIGPAPVATGLSTEATIRLEKYKALRQGSTMLAATQTTIVWAAVAGFGVTLATVSAGAAPWSRFWPLPR